MPFTVDDRIYADPMVNSASLAAVGLWACLDRWQHDHSTGGVAPDEVIAALGGTPELRAQMIAAGLASELRKGVEIHGSVYTGRVTAASPEDGGGGHRMPCGRQSSPAPLRQALYRDPELRQAVRDKDGDRCRVCGGTVRWGAGRAADSGTYRLSDPSGPYSLDNIIVACRSCGSSGDLAIGRRVTAAENAAEEPRYASRYASRGPLKHNGTLDDDDFNHHHPNSPTADQHGYGPAKHNGGTVTGKRNAELAASVADEVRIRSKGALDITPAQAGDAIKVLRRRAEQAGTRIGASKGYFATGILNEADPWAELLCPPSARLSEILADPPAPAKATRVGGPPPHQFTPDEHGNCSICPLPARNPRHLSTIGLVS